MFPAGHGVAGRGAVETADNLSGWIWAGDRACSVHAVAVSSGGNTALLGVSVLRWGGVGLEGSGVSEGLDIPEFQAG